MSEWWVARVWLPRSGDSATVYEAWGRSPEAARSLLERRAPAPLPDDAITVEETPYTERPFTEFSWGPDDRQEGISFSSTDGAAPLPTRKKLTDE